MDLLSSPYLGVRYARKYMARLTGMRGFFSGKVDVSPSSPALDLPGAASVDGVRPGYVPGSATTAAPGGTPYVEGLTRSAARWLTWSTPNRTSDGYNGTPGETVVREGAAPGTAQPESPHDTAPGSSAPPSGEGRAGFWYRGTLWWPPWGSGVLEAEAPSAETTRTAATGVGEEVSADDEEPLEAAGAPGSGASAWPVWYPRPQSWRIWGWGREAPPEPRAELAYPASPEAVSMEDDSEFGSARGAAGGSWSPMAWLPWGRTRGSGMGEEAPVREEPEFPPEALPAEGDAGEGVVASAEAEAREADSVAPTPQRSWSRRWWPGSASDDAFEDAETPNAEADDELVESPAEDPTGEGSQGFPSAGGRDRDGAREQETEEVSEKLTEGGEVAQAAGAVEGTAAEPGAGAGVPDARLWQVQSLLGRWWRAPGPQQAPAVEVHPPPTDVVPIDAIQAAETSGADHEAYGAAGGSTPGEILHLDESSSLAEAEEGLRNHVETPSGDDCSEASPAPWRAWLTFKASPRAPPPRVSDEEGDGDPTRESGDGSESSPAGAGVEARSQDDERVTGEIFMGAEAYDMLAEATPGSELYGLLEPEAYQDFPVPETGRVERIALERAAAHPTSDEGTFEAYGSRGHAGKHDGSSRSLPVATDAPGDPPGAGGVSSAPPTTPPRAVAGANESLGVDAGFVHEDEASGAAVPGETREEKDSGVTSAGGGVDDSVGEEPVGRIGQAMRPPGTEETPRTVGNDNDLSEGRE